METEEKAPTWVYVVAFAILIPLGVVAALLALTGLVLYAAIVIPLRFMIGTAALPLSIYSLGSEPVRRVS